MNCAQEGCSGHIVDGYCDVCGMKPRSEPPPPVAAVPPPLSRGDPETEGAPPSTATARRPSTVRAATRRSRLGGGLVEIPPVPALDPAGAVMANPVVAEHRRFCGRCGQPVGRSREGSPGRADGFCRSCGAPFSFTPKLAPGDVVAGQYEVVGCLAHGGMGWIYLARDHNVSDRWVVLKGLLNTGDDDAMATALAERRFLAEVEHPNIVKIFNFVQHDDSGYIVMEYVGGSSLLDIVLARREAAGGVHDPLPAPEAIAYILEILPALGYLHRNGLLFCDFKLSNVIQTEHSLKLIDLGGVYRMDDESAPIYGTVGYQAPEVAETGPSVPSDLYTVGRTLALLCVDFQGFQSTFRFTLPPPETVPLFGELDSLYRLLLKATAPSSHDRFQSAEEMADQALGVLREAVAMQRGTPVPGPSTLFTGDFRAAVDGPDWRHLPLLQVDSDDPAAGYLGSLSGQDPDQLVELLRAAPDHTVEVELRLARTLIDAGRYDQASEVIEGIEAGDAWEWRAAWYRGVMGLAQSEWPEARERFDAVLSAVPGELAPKLACGVTAEYARDHSDAAHWYEIVSRTDAAFTTATLGLARCRLATGDRAGALAAYDRVPETSRSHLDAQIARIRCLIGARAGQAPALADLRAAGAGLEALDLDGEQRAQLTTELLLAALNLLEAGGTEEDPDTRVAGQPLTEREVRTGLERGYRTLARVAGSQRERIRLVDWANRVRPRTWT